MIPSKRKHPPRRAPLHWGSKFLEDFWKGFQNCLDRLAWREARLCVSIASVLMRVPLILTYGTDTFLRAFNSCEIRFCRVFDITFAILHCSSRLLSLRVS